MKLVRKIGRNMLNISRYYRRNRLLWLVLALAVLFFVIFFSPQFFRGGVPNTREIVDYINGTNFFISVVVVVIGLTGISHAIRRRTLKTYFSRPCSPEVWYISHLLSLVLLAAVLIGTNFIFTNLLLSWLKISAFMEISALFVYNFLSCLILISITSLLAILTHPVLAGALAIVINDTVFFVCFDIFTRTIGWPSVTFFDKFLPELIWGIYTVLPTYHPYFIVLPKPNDSEVAIHELITNLVLKPGVYEQLTLIGCYTLVFLLVSFFGGSYLLHQRNLQ